MSGGDNLKADELRIRCVSVKVIRRNQGIIQENMEILWTSYMDDSQREAVRSKLRVGLICQSFWDGPTQPTGPLALNAKDKSTRELRRNSGSPLDPET